jgi:hypothetical protein
MIADLDPFERQRERLRILDERPRRACVNRPRELIEHDDQREPGARAR